MTRLPSLTGGLLALVAQLLPAVDSAPRSDRQLMLHAPETPRLWTWEFPPPRSFADPHHVISDARVVEADGKPWSVVLLVSYIVIGRSSSASHMQWISSTGTATRRVPLSITPDRLVAGNSQAPWLFLSPNSLTSVDDAGAIRWTCPLASIAEAYQEGDLVLAVVGDDLVAVSAADGTQRWRRAGLGTPVPGKRPYMTYQSSRGDGNGGETDRIVSHLHIEQIAGGFAHLLGPDGRLLIDLRTGNTLCTAVWNPSTGQMPDWHLHGDLLLQTEPIFWSVAGIRLPDRTPRWRYRPPAAAAGRPQTDGYPAAIIGTVGSGDETEAVILDHHDGTLRLRMATGAWTRLTTGDQGIGPVRWTGAWQDVLISGGRGFPVTWRQGTTCWRMSCNGVAYGTDIAVAHDSMSVWAIHRPLEPKR